MKATELEARDYAEMPKGCSQNLWVFTAWDIGGRLEIVDEWYFHNRDTAKQAFESLTSSPTYKQYEIYCVELLQKREGTG